MAMTPFHDPLFGLLYVDPGSGSMLIQVVLAFFLGASITFRKVIYGAWIKVTGRKRP